MSPFVSTAQAQPTTFTWEGFYAGFHVGVRHLPASPSNLSIAPRIYPDYIYTALPKMANFSLGTDAARSFHFGGRIGYMLQRSRLVFGVELQGDIGKSLTSVFGETNNGLVTTPGQFGGTTTPCAPNPQQIGCISTATDQVSVISSLSATGALRFNAGFLAGDNLLLSIFAGPAIGALKLSATQTSKATYSYSFFPCTPSAFVSCHFSSIGGSISSTPVSRQRSTAIAGATVGAALDYRLTENWSVRAEYSFTKFKSATLDLPVPNSGVSSVTVRPKLHTVRFGVAYLF